MTIALNQCLQGDALEVLTGLAAAGIKVNCVVTSPPYWGLRDYGAAGQIGLEPTFPEYVEKLTRVFDLVRDLLVEDGTLWLNLGDTSSVSRSYQVPDNKHKAVGNSKGMHKNTTGLPDKNLIGIPWRVAFALQNAGWILRSAIVWHKPNPMTESVKDRPTRAYEHIFLFSISGRYFYDFEAAREPATYRNQYESTSTFCRKVNEPNRPGYDRPQHRPDRVRKYHSLRPGIDVKGGNQGEGFIEFSPNDRNWRDVWTIPPQPCADEHFATFPEALVRRCIIAGSRPDDLVLDPFMGSGTTAVVAEKMGRRWLGIELNPEYLEIQARRLAKVTPLLKVAGL